ncbi:protein STRICTOSIDINE SYNTHASE-LIKE 2 isoform X2 [Morus notabilis]|uniref:protein STRICTOSIDINE SYNTHASE-LIKE 2 isoform X2 n=1 Tax=Morus notabilis TaxID=981085 RepID=UPI000CED0F9E|nr:protein STRICTOSIDINE SYNTHASE-LIKE 2 isoform X2 [Morus notabilis]
MTTPKLFSTAAAFAVLFSALFAANHVFDFASLSTKDPKSLSDHDHDHHDFGHFEFLPIVGALGPESYAFDSLGDGPYTGVSDGRIIKWQEDQRRWIDFAVTSPNRSSCEGSHDHHLTEHICGRPLGLSFHKTSGDLYIADAYMGLLVVGAEGGLATRVVTQAQGVPFAFPNGLDINDENGLVYFTDSSSRYQRRNYLSVILSGDTTGRLMSYDPQSKQVDVLLENLSFPNGVALSQNGDFLLIAETTSCRIMRYWLRTPKAGTFEVFSQLPGFPDNIKGSPRGGFWVGIHSERKKVFELILSYPSIAKAILQLPFDVMKAYTSLGKWRGRGLMIRLSEEGVLLDVLEDKSGVKWKAVSEVEERDGNLWIGSIHKPYAGKITLNDTN